MPQDLVEKHSLVKPRTFKAAWPGMSVLVAIERMRRDDCVHLPRSAVQETPAGFVALRADGSPVALRGSWLGPDAFVVESGLAAGEQVRIRP